MSTGFDGGSSGNIWGSVLAMEGAVLFASASTKRLESTVSGRPSFPFAVSPSFAGDGCLATSASARPEFWLPSWSAPATVREITALLSEGRVTLGKRQASSGIDMLESLSSLGSSRGIAAFERHGFYERRGKGYFVATCLGRFNVPQVATDNWIMRNLGKNDWLTRFRRFAQDDNTARRFSILRKRLEDTLFALAGREPSKAEAQALLVLLGEIQSALSNSKKALENARPIPRLSERWVQAADDGSPAFRIAKALAGLRGVGDQPLPLRAQLFPIHRRFDQWMTADAGEKVRIYTGRQGRLVDTLRHLLGHRLWLAERLEMRDKPLDGPAGATLEDLAAFLRDDGMDARIDDLLPGLALCDIPRDADRSAGDGGVPPAFGLIKLSLTPDCILHSLQMLPGDQRLPVPAGMLAQLAAGNHDNRAVKAAWRRLRASGLAPLFSPNTLPAAASIHSQRACAALLIPLRYGASGVLARSLLQQDSSANRSVIEVA
jgi:CRISPR-associated protein Csx17